jgi:DNA-binding winged helix-turn-helix (wHTH) protein/TolB-like protein
MTYRFGPFEFDAASGELRQEGASVRLQAQPAHVLGLLLAHAGEVVTRDALRNAVWGPGTFVDFDKGLNFAIAQVRAALGDSAEAPTYVRTLPKRGYQFIAPVEPAPVVQPFTAAPTGGLPARLKAYATKRALFAAGIFLTAFVAVYTWRATASPPTLAVVAFDNETGQTDLDGYAQGITDALVAELTARGVGRISVIGNAAVLRTRRPFRDLLSIAQSLHARYVVIGQLQRDGDRVRLLAHLIRLPEQTHVWVTRIERLAADPPMLAADAARRISEEFLRRL